MTEPVEMPRLEQPADPAEPRMAPIVEQSRIEPRTENTEPDKGTKLSVMFFFLLVPPLGVVLLASVCWMIFRRWMAAD